MSIHLLTFGVVLALVAIFFAIMPLLSRRERESMRSGGAGGLFVFVGVFGFLSLLCFAGYWSIESGKTRKVEQDRQVKLEWQQKEDAKRRAKESLPVGDESIVRRACSKGKDRVLAKVYAAMLANDLSVSDEIQISSSRTTITVKLTLLTESAKELRKSGYLDRKVGIGTPVEYKGVFEEAGLKEPTVFVNYIDPEWEKYKATLRTQTNSSLNAPNSK